MRASEDKSFRINVSIGNLGETTITVNYKETTDGLPFYECDVNGQNVQIRKDERWEVIWGELSPEDTERLGKAIEKQATKY